MELRWQEHEILNGEELVEVPAYYKGVLNPDEGTIAG
jgi:hypothetical protein